MNALATDRPIGGLNLARNNKIINQARDAPIEIDLSNGSGQRSARSHAGDSDLDRQESPQRTTGPAYMICVSTSKLVDCIASEGPLIRS